MTPERFRELRRLFDDALLQPPGVRAAWLADACGDDPELRRQLEALLAADLTTGAAASRALFLVKPDGAPSDPPLEGRRIGHYTLGPEIGRGGMSVVYRATRTDRLFSREVAVKVVRADAADAERLKRFEQEREIVARLDHPNIARLLDGGTTDEGLHYSVIEYVEGERIDGYCDARQLDVHGRVALVRTICDAVQYAHQHLVIHRDLKPSNILVTGDGQVKLLDFGIAKLLEPGVEDTMNPAGRLMTVAYASPEQMKGERVSTQSDIYSLGVILYELLAGRRPHGGGTATPYELARAVCDEEPRPPSVAARELGAARASRLDAELDAIVLMALRKEPERRYASAASLDDDLRRYLAGLPVVAQPDSLRYRAHKFVQRHRAGVWVAAAGAVLIAASLLGMTWQARVAQVERARAEEQAASALAQSRRAEEQSAAANAYRREAEREAAAARQQLAIATEQRAEAERQRRDAALERERADRRTRDLRSISTALLALNASLPDVPASTAAARRAAEAARQGLLAVGADGPRDPSLDRDVAAAAQIVERSDASRASIRPGVPDGWTFFSGAADSFESGIDHASLHGASAYIRGMPRVTAAGSLEQILDGGPYRGRRVRISAVLRSLAVERYAGLAFRILSNLETTDWFLQPGLRATNDWSRYSLVFDVPADAGWIAFGFGLSGSGSVWGDDFAVEVVDDGVPPTPRLPPRPSGLDFER